MVRLKIWKKIYPERWVLPQGCTEAEMQPFFGILTLVTFLWSAWVYWITFSLEFCAPMTCPFLLRSRNSCKNLTYDWGLQGLSWFLTPKNKCLSPFVIVSKWCYFSIFYKIKHFWHHLEPIWVKNLKIRQHHYFSLTFLNSLAKN